MPKTPSLDAGRLRETLIDLAVTQLPSVTHAQLAEIFDMHEKSVSRVLSKQHKMSCQDKEFRALAYKGLGAILKRKKGKKEEVKVTRDGDVIRYVVEERPTYTNQMDAIKEVLDRVEPKKREENQPVTNFIQINYQLDTHKDFTCQSIDTPQDIVVGQVESLHNSECKEIIVINQDVTE